MNRVTDPAKVWPIWSHPKVHPWVVDDFSDRAPMPESVSHPNVVCLMPDSQDAYTIFIPHRFVIWELHGAVLPEARHKSLMFGQRAIAWMKENTPCRLILSYVPKGNFRAMALDRALGFTKVGVLERSHLLGGKLHNMTLMSLSL